jgi:A/G-specific adenine glycosylase
MRESKHGRGTPDRRGTAPRKRQVPKKDRSLGDERAYREAVLAWGQANARAFPWRETRDPYEVLIGEVLLQRTRGTQVVPVYERFTARWPSPQRLGRAREASIATVVRPLGLAKRAPVLKALGRALAARGRVPLDPDELICLPGVGPYASHAVPVFAADKDLPLVDWVIARILRRYFGLKEGKVPNADRDLWSLAARLARPGQSRLLWLATLDLAHAVCRPRPICPSCPLVSTCRFVALSEGPPRIT